jgi:hypothetical protein
MDKYQHTGGQWTFGDLHGHPFGCEGQTRIETDGPYDDKLIATVHHSIDPKRREGAGNIRLLVHAPDMLACLQQVKAEVQKLSKDGHLAPGRAKRIVGIINKTGRKACRAMMRGPRWYTHGR